MVDGAGACFVRLRCRRGVMGMRMRIAVVDGGPLYDAMARRLATGGVPTFRSADRALRVLNAILERDQGSART